MAITVGGMSSGRRSRGVSTISEINVTPFVDVALVLLIIFMITAHAMDSGVEVDVPKTQTVNTQTKDLPVVTITKDGNLFLGKDPVKLVELTDRLKEKYAGQEAVYIKADRLTTMDIGVKVMNELGHANFKINMVSQLDDAGRKH